MTPVYKKRIRLKRFSYKGCHRYFVTICAKDKKTVFHNRQTVNFVREVLCACSREHAFMIWAYCFMPDHLHLLIEGTAEHADMKKFMAAFKQKTGYYYKQQNGFDLWQKNYYEHVLRRDEDTRSTIRYICDNPVRKGLVADFREYEFLGSFADDRDDVLQDII